MGHSWRLCAATAALATTAISLSSQAQRAPYERADRIRTFDPSLVGGQIHPVFLADSIRFYYEATGTGAERGTLFLVDPRNRGRRPLFDNGRVAAALSALPTPPSIPEGFRRGSWWMTTGHAVRAPTAILLVHPRHAAVCPSGQLRGSPLQHAGAPAGPCGRLTGMGRLRLESQRPVVPRA